MEAALSRAICAAAVCRVCKEELLADSIVERSVSADSLVRVVFGSENAFLCLLVF